MFYTGIATVRWHWNGRSFEPTVTRQPEATTGVDACTQTLIGTDTNVVFYSGPTSAGDWAIGGITDYPADADMDFVTQEVFQFAGGHWTDVGEFFIDANCSQGLLASGMPRDIALELSPGDLCLLAPIDTFVPEPATGPLFPGDSGDRVRALQVALQRIVDPALEADGYYGLDTERAVIILQRANGLAATGIAGPETFSALDLPYS